MKCLLASITVLFCPIFSNAFTTVGSGISLGIARRPTIRTFTGLPQSSQERHTIRRAKQDFDDVEPPPVDVRMFLTQRCIQSFMVLLASLHDAHTLNWLDDFTQPVNFCPRDVYEPDENVETKAKEDPTWLQNDRRLTNSRLLSYHGTEAMNTTRFPTWESYFLDLANLPSTTLTIQTNALVNFVNKMSEFEVDIEPPRLCARLLSVREQIANEWISDLEAIGSVGFDIYYSYWEKVRDQGLDAQQQSFERQSTLFLDPRYDNDVSPSPFRKVNYDLLYNLATQESIHRVLEQGISVEQDSDGAASTEFLRQFYKERIRSHFNDGISFGRADDFLDELMQCVPEIRSPSSSELVIVNPVTIAEVVLKTREAVAADWQKIMRNVPNEHSNIRKLMLSKMMAQ